ncbi:hypothetical protein HPB47_025584 [Ixodes persulcatus]|uniref:Uncharacterized protein n=1 Tax=Ixodes persulcatus TaxID=34615 RepID=A0AC60Q3H6_IXOPE|nr:hypothetical protein HPB47_025584 [Ixodes persulcatus]
MAALSEAEQSSNQDDDKAESAEDSEDRAESAEDWENSAVPLPLETPVVLLDIGVQVSSGGFGENFSRMDDKEDVCSFPGLFKIELLNVLEKLVYGARALSSLLKRVSQEPAKAATKRARNQDHQDDNGDADGTGKPRVQLEAGWSAAALARRRRLGWRVGIDGAAVVWTRAPQQVHLLSTGVKASQELEVRPGHFRPDTQECAGLATAPAECVLVPQGRELRDSSACPPPSLGSSGLLKTRNPTPRPLSHLHLRNDRRLQDPTYDEHFSIVIKNCGSRFSFTTVPDLNPGMRDLAKEKRSLDSSEVGSITARD